MNNKYFIYARKSTDTEDRQVRSIDDQLSELRELAKKENLEVIDTLVEKQTAKIPGRPIFNEMISRIEAGEASGILCWHPDRLARNSIDGGRLIYLVDMCKITALKFCVFWFDPTPQGKFMLSIAFSQSKYYIDNLSENIKRGHRNKLKNGLWPQMAPLGYLNEKNTKKIIVDPNKANLIKKSFELYAGGTYTLSNLRKTINDLGLIGPKGKTLWNSNYQYLLKNPFYYGLIRYNGEFYEGKHEAIISKQLFDQVQEVMTRKSKINPRVSKLKPYTYRGLLECGECGCTITTETQKGHNYLRCTKRKIACSQPYAREDNISQQMSEKISQVSLPDSSADWVLAEINNERESETQQVASQVDRFNNEVVLIEGKLEKLMTAYLDSALSLEEYKTKKNELINQKQLLKSKIDALASKSVNRFERISNFISASKQAKRVAQESNPQSLREWIQKISSNPLLTGGMLDSDFRNPWRILEKYNSAPQSGAAISSGILNFEKLRIGWDSNPRRACAHGGLVNRWYKPLTDLSSDCIIAK